MDYEWLLVGHWSYTSDAGGLLVAVAWPVRCDSRPVSG